MQAPGNPGINNTAYLFGVVALAFVLFITMRGDLPKWLGLLGLGASTAPASGTSTASSNPSGTSGLPGLPNLPSIGQSNASISSPTNGVPSLATDNLSPVNTGYTGPTYIDTTSTF